MPQVKVWLEVTGNGRREKMLRFQSVQSPPVHKRCYAVSVNGEYLIGLTTPGRNHIGYYADEAEEAMQEAVNQAVTDLFEAAYDDYCETSNEPGCLYAIQPGSHGIEIDDHPIGGAHWVQANAVIHIGQGFEKGDPKCDPDDEFPEDGSWPRLEVQVTAPTYPGIPLGTFLSEFNPASQSDPSVVGKLERLVAALETKPIAEYAGTFGSAVLYEQVIVDGSNTYKIQITVNPTTVYVTLESEGDIWTSYWLIESGSTTTHLHLGLDPESLDPLEHAWPEPFELDVLDGIEEVGFKEVFELRQDSEGGWELSPFTSTNPEGSVWDSPAWVAKPVGLGVLSSPSGVMGFDLSMKSFEVIDPGDNPACRWNLHYLMRNPETGQCGPQVYDLWSRPDTRFPPKMYPLCSVTVENVLPSEVPV